METQKRKPTLLWAALSLLLPVAMILYGTLVVGVRPPVLPLLGAVALAAVMARRTGYSWEELQDGMFEALGRIQIAIAILAMVGAGEYASVEEACRAIIRADKVQQPIPENSAAYKPVYELYTRLYPALKASFAELQKL